MSRDERAPRIKNRAPAPVQISAEQLLREAQERQEAPLKRATQRFIAWIRYAEWEASQGELPRARSVFERALDVDPRHPQLWLRYVDLELKSRNIQHARNLLDRAVSILPRIDQFWYKYVHLEELLSNVVGARQVFERWMAWEPDERAWAAYVGMEVRYNELENASAVWERAVSVHPEPKLWIRWAKFEEERGAMDRARRVFTMALEYFGEDEDKMEKAQTVYTAFAKMETRAKEIERAKVIYRYALERLPRTKSSGIYASYTRFEKQFGNRQGVEDTVLGKRRIQYEEEVTSGLPGAATNYDTWFDYTRLEEDAYRAILSGGAARDSQEAKKAQSRVRDIYERAVANIPPSKEKRHWRRYIFFWLDYALFEEVDAQDVERTREVYKAAVALVPHKEFSFAKLWLNYASFEVRRLDLTAARKILGTSIGLCPKEKLFKGYIELEISLKEFDRARKIYERCLSWDASNSRTWIRFAELERNLFDMDRARGIFELATKQPELDMPEVLWKAYIDFEFDERQWSAVQDLFERLLRKTKHVKVWISYANSFIGAAIAEEEDEDQGDEDEGEEEVAPKQLTEDQVAERREKRKEAAKRSRDTFERAYADLKQRGLKEERVLLLEAWKSFESQHGNLDEELAPGAAENANLKSVKAKMPRVVKKRRQTSDGEGLEEYYDMVFPDDDDGSSTSFKLLQMAHAWRAKQQAAAAAAAAAASNGADAEQTREAAEADDGASAVTEEASVKLDGPRQVDAEAGWEDS
ncbi:pre-mrna-splicing factor clf1 [Ceraceosorus bombacis]|uniref:Pre-mrna-splicing factor clf1 n=1 Tax=Ceraceosorus bombacis TaxID=401625 RepID=A0A0P1BPS5_9BASI|nr:pre-mrna-splicing factor clf1 [Ceraceosorus bombacis]